MMLSFDYWMWWIFGAVLLFAEMIVPGVFLLWIGLAAFLVGVIDFFVPLSVVVQLSLFGALSLASVILGRKIYNIKKANTNYDTLNDRSSQYIGQVFVLTTAIKEGRGKAKVGDTQWIVEGPDLPEGTQVKVIGASGTILKVEPH